MKFWFHFAFIYVNLNTNFPPLWWFVHCQTPYISCQITKRFIVVHNVLTLLFSEYYRHGQNNPELSESAEHISLFSTLICWLAGTQTVLYCTMLVEPNDTTLLAVAFSLLGDIVMWCKTA